MPQTTLSTHTYLGASKTDAHDADDSALFDARRPPIGRCLKTEKGPLVILHIARVV